MDFNVPSLDWLSDTSVFRVNRINAHSDHQYFKDESEYRNGKSDFKMSLNGKWKFSYAVNPSLRVKDFYKDDFDCSAFDEINVPGHIQTQGYDNMQYINTLYPWDGQEELRPPHISEKYNPVASYVKYFDLEDIKMQDNLYISFQGVENAFYLWINGHFVGYSEDSFTPSEFNIGDYVVSGRNKIAVEVYKRSTGAWLEDQDFWRFSGIFRDVYLYTVPKTHIRDIFIRTDLYNEYKDADLSAELKVEGDICSSIDFVLKDKNDETVSEVKSLRTEKSVLMNMKLENIHTWSAEDPYLYKLNITVKDNDGNTVEFIKQNVGFRCFEMINKVMCINGKRIIFKGVNRHEFNCHNGRSITKEDMLFDIKFMKKNNINAVRTCHYPNNSYWYELCDEYGIYLIDETNLETHGSWQKLGKISPEWVIPGDREEWLDIILDRAESMLERDKNHPSIIIWSCGNESFGGKDIYEMSNYFRRRDPSRLVHYEGVFNDRRYNDTSDMESRMYAKVNDIEEYLENNPSKPYISCEYMHAMGNSCGNMFKYIALEDKYEMYQGGFIWDYIDQGILAKDKYGKQYFAYGSDFDDRANDFNFCGNGIIYADRTVSPKVQEVKRLYSNIKISVDKYTAVIRNDNLFIDTSNYNFIYSLMLNGEKIYEKTLSDIVVMAGKESRINLDLPESNLGGEYTITVSACLKEDTVYAEKGHIVTSSQYVYSIAFEDTLSSTKKINVVHGDGNIGVMNDSFKVIFSKTTGGILSLKYGTKEIISNVAPTPIYWRATTDNDRGNGQGFRCAQWYSASMFKKLCDFKVSDDEYKAVIEYTFENPTYVKTLTKVTYTVDGEGLIRVDAKYTGAEGLPHMPAFGMVFKISSDFDKFKYYGLGPDENYEDRCCGADLGIYESSVKDNVSRYLMPQESGNRIGVRYVNLTTEEKESLTFSFLDKPFEIGVSPYSAFEIENALHHNELPKVNYTYVTIYERQMGVGGDDSWGAMVHDEFLLDSSKDHEVNFIISR